MSKILSFFHSAGKLVMICGGIGIVLNFAWEYREKPVGIKIQTAMRSMQPLRTSEGATVQTTENGCSPVHLKLNSCNTLPNYYMYADRRDEFRSAIINFWHIQKAGGSSIERCLEEMQLTLKLPETQRVGVSCKQMKQAYSNLKYFQNNTYQPVMRGHNSLGLCDFFHDIISERKCSIFTIFREPYERVVSHYYFNRQVARGGFPGILFQGTLTMSIAEWLKLSGSPTWVAFSRVWETSVTANRQLKCKMISKNIRGQRWPTNDKIIDEIINNLDKYVSFVGLLEDMPTTLEMLEEVYNLPFLTSCQKSHVNKGRYEGLNVTEQSKLEITTKRMLMEDEEIRKLMSFDVRLYEKAKEIFNAQKKIRAGG